VFVALLLTLKRLLVFNGVCERERKVAWKPRRRRFIWDAMAGAWSWSGWFGFRLGEEGCRGTEWNIFLIVWSFEFCGDFGCLSSLYFLDWENQSLHYACLFEWRSWTKKVQFPEQSTLTWILDSSQNNVFVLLFHIILHDLISVVSCHVKNLNSDMLSASRVNIEMLMKKVHTQRLVWGKQTAWGDKVCHWHNTGQHIGISSLRVLAQASCSS
jgi:hypothetical protein